MTQLEQGQRECIPPDSRAYRRFIARRGSTAPKQIIALGDAATAYEEARREYNQIVAETEKINL